MSPKSFSQRFSRRTVKFLRFLLSVLLVFALLTFSMILFLRVVGIPKPILREILAAVHRTGIPVYVDQVVLTLDGWRGRNIEIYSKHPDDLKPVFSAQKVLIRRLCSDESGKHRFRFSASGVEVTPSVGMHILMPDKSKVGVFQKISAEIGFDDACIEVKQAVLKRDGVDLFLDGHVCNIKRYGQQPKEAEGSLTNILFDTHQVEKLDAFLQAIDRSTPVQVRAGFNIDLLNPEDAVATLEVEATPLQYKKEPFTHFYASMAYRYPVVQLNRLELSQSDQHLYAEGSYHLTDHAFSGSVTNGLLNKELLFLLPGRVLDHLATAAIRLEQLPEFTCTFGPLSAAKPFNAAAGRFCIRGCGYKGAEAEEIRGMVYCTNGVVNVTNLTGTLLCAYDQSAETGSSMQGGTASGTAFWDNNSRTFGIDVHTEFDPNLLARSLAPVKVATNVIHRFSFPDTPPRLDVALGANVDDWSSFYLEIDADADAFSYQTVPFTSATGSVTYHQKILKIVPLSGWQGENQVTASVVVDFERDMVFFEGEGKISPNHLERLILQNNHQSFCSNFTFSGNSYIQANGAFDWAPGSADTDFSAVMDIDRVASGFGMANKMEAEVIGEAGRILINSTNFEFYGGSGNLGLIFSLIPFEGAVPYQVDFSADQAELRDFVKDFTKSSEINIYGKLSGTLQYEADLRKPFFESATGGGSIQVEDGQLAEMSIFKGLSGLIRFIIPTFNVFSITHLSGDFKITDGVISSEQMLFEGDLVSARGAGSYRVPEGFDAYVHAQLFRDNKVSRIFRVLSYPFAKLTELHLSGTLTNPRWKLKRVPDELQNLLKGNRTKKAIDKQDMPRENASSEGS